MLWFTQKVLRKEAGNWTFVMVTDRAELDNQLYGDFADCGVITSGQRVHAETSEHLRELLGQDHRYVFTLIHKFIPPERGQRMPILSERSDIVVITGRGASLPVRHAGGQYAPGAAQRVVYRIHRHSAHHRGGRADPTGVRRLRVDLQLPRLHRRRRHRSPLLREPHPPSSSSSTTTSTGSSKTSSRPPRSTTPRRRRWPASSPASTS